MTLPGLLPPFRAFVAHARLYTVSLTGARRTPILSWRLRPERRQWAELKEGAYLLRAFGCDTTDPAQLWEMYVQLTEAEAAFRAFKSELRVRPIWHRKAQRVEAHLLVVFLGYALWVALKHTLRGAGHELSPARALHELAQMLSADLLLEAVTGETLRLRRVQELDLAQAALLESLQVELPRRLTDDVEM